MGLHWGGGIIRRQTLLQTASSFVRETFVCRTKFKAPAMDHQSHYDYMLIEQETVAKSIRMHISPSDNLLHSTGGMIVIIDCVEMHRFVNGHYLPVKSLCDILN